ncbi:MAG: SH3 domain-containing protein [Clostridia bacterium]|nr:SH3 domain-containing protein [Clostridia bacterium]
MLPAVVARRLLGASVTVEGDSVVLTTPGQVIDLVAGEPVADVNEQRLELRTPLRQGEEGPLLPADLLEAVYGVRFAVDRETRQAFLLRPGETHLAGELREARYPSGSLAEGLRRSVATVTGLFPLRRGPAVVPLRAAPSPRAPVVASGTPGERAWILEEAAPAWWRVRTRSGGEGYVPATQVRLLGIRPLTEFVAEGGGYGERSGREGPESQEGPKKDAERADAPPVLPAATDWRRRGPGQPLSGRRLTVVFEHVVRETPDPDTIGSLAGVDVVAPTWFVLADGEGHFLSKADARYVAWAHRQDMAVWGTATNAFDPARTREALRGRAQRREMVRQLLAYAAAYGLDGINLDFENVDFADRDRFTQFVRELVPPAHAQGLTVSVDVTVKSTSPNWSLVYDRRALASAADYVVLMAYDEHPAASPVAGPVASLPWVEAGLRGVLAEVTPEKLLLGVPLYTRLWWEEASGKVRSTTVSMRNAVRLPDRKGREPVWDAASQLRYLEYVEGETRYRVWLEDADSLKARLALVQKYDLAGVAAWRRGFEAEGTWELVAAAMARWP